VLTRPGGGRCDDEHVHSSRGRDEQGRSHRLGRAPLSIASPGSPWHQRCSGPSLKRRAWPLSSRCAAQLGDHRTSEVDRLESRERRESRSSCPSRLPRPDHYPGVVTRRCEQLHLGVVSSSCSPNRLGVTATPASSAPGLVSSSSSGLLVLTVSRIRRRSRSLQPRIAQGSAISDLVVLLLRR